jgi:hypothetical protein
MQFSTFRLSAPGESKPTATPKLRPVPSLLRGMLVASFPRGMLVGL